MEPPFIAVFLFKNGATTKQDMPVFVRYVFLETHQCNSPKSLMKLCIRESATLNERSNESLSAFQIVSTRLKSRRDLPLQRTLDPFSRHANLTQHPVFLKHK